MEMIAKQLKKRKRLKSGYLFAVLMMALPLVQFAVFYVYVNFNSWVMAFQIPLDGEYVFSLQNFKSFFESLRYDGNSQFKYMLLNTLYLFVAGDLIALPLTVFFSYLFYKKIAGSQFYKVILYLPTVISIVMMTLVFRYFITVNGPMYLAFDKLFGVRLPDFFGDSRYAIHTIMFFNVWSGLGYSVILLSGVMARFPVEIFESLRIDGAGYTKEFFKVVVPLAWPTICTLFVLNLANAFTNFSAFMLFTPSNYEIMRTDVIGYYVYRSAGSFFYANQGAAVGFIVSAIALPIVLLARFLLSKTSEEVTF